MIREQEGRELRRCTVTVPPTPSLAGAALGQPLLGGYDLGWGLMGCSWMALVLGRIDGVHGRARTNQRISETPPEDSLVEPYLEPGTVPKTKGLLGGVCVHKYTDVIYF